ncbi:helix-turn-helix transcriptional regulator [Streptomyces sp. DSM 44917]|uniref:Helix-turn-helix transcriptional regulator n=1 Tax=Streptomyces boetiae TaxID=3075541 RepID=A0ABU2LA56_9ACTN|nr:helix-turn-helix transcriptional regulator [Streptomyces sp. DSM 44917]MDT0308366.1 helix-turn-helix transcriptional regulator [Streptomyces sp. DSM 44917]
MEPNDESDDRAESFGVWLARQLRRRGMTQHELAEALGMTRAGVSAWITERSEPREDKKRAIARILGVDEAAVHLRTVDAPSERPVEWRHRLAHRDGGREFGNAAAFAFDADLDVLAREATQNSLDERLPGGEPVRVRYVLHELTGARLKDFLAALRWEEDLRPHYEAAAAHRQKVGRAVAEGLRQVEEAKSLILLRIEDYNASGLTGPEYGDGRFAAVVRRQLDSHKATGKGRAAGGSYGLGKATLWATSRLGLVLMNSTLSTPHEGRTERRLVGRLDLPWREVGGEAYAGPAWLGEEDTEPAYEGHQVSRSWWADEQITERLHLTRTDPAPGTSFLVVGAHDVGVRDGEGAGEEDETGSVQAMHAKLVRSLAQNFWAAMTRGGSSPALLEASVTTLRDGQVLLQEEIVDPHTHEPARTRALRAFLEGTTVERLTGADQVALARVRLAVPPPRDEKAPNREHSAVLLVTPADDSDARPNTLVCMRGNRMAIRTRRVPDLPLGTNPFQAVLLAGYATRSETEDARLAEEFLRSAEPPEHDDWTRTEELITAYAPGARQRILDFRRDMYAAVRALVSRPKERTGEGPEALRQLLRLDAGTGAAGRRPEGHPTIRDVVGELDASGAWRVRVEVKLPRRDDPWLMTPVAKFDVRSGGRPTLRWAELIAGQNCHVDGGRLRFEPGARSASFSGVTDVDSHPVAARMARLVIDLQRTREADA